jgi:hypothetical protein
MGQGWFDRGGLGEGLLAGLEYVVAEGVVGKRVGDDVGREFLVK